MTNPLPPPPPRGTPVLNGLGLFVQPWSGWFRKLYDYLQNQSTGTSGFTGTVTLGPLSQGGTAGSLTFTNGILSSVIEPTAGPAGLTDTIITAPLSEGGAEGSMTFEDGILTGEIQATIGTEHPIITES